MRDRWKKADGWLSQLMMLCCCLAGERTDDDGRHAQSAEHNRSCLACHFRRPSQSFCDQGSWRPRTLIQVPATKRSQVPDACHARSTKGHSWVHALCPAIPGARRWTPSIIHAVFCSSWCDSYASSISKLCSSRAQPKLNCSDCVNSSSRVLITLQSLYSTARWRAKFPSGNIIVHIPTLLHVAPYWSSTSRPRVQDIVQLYAIYRHICKRQKREEGRRWPTMSDLTRPIRSATLRVQLR